MIKRLEDDGDHEVGTNSEITVKVDFVRKESAVMWWSNTWGDEWGWQSTPFQAVHFNSIEEAVTKVADWIDGQC